MSIPRYTCIESIETISMSGTARAMPRARADLPDAVVPTRAIGPSAGRAAVRALAGGDRDPRSAAGAADHLAQLAAERVGASPRDLDGGRGPGAQGGLGGE